MDLDLHMSNFAVDDAINLSFLKVLIDQFFIHLSDWNGFLLNPPTTGPLTINQPTTFYFHLLTSIHQITNPIITDRILFKRLDNKKMSLLYNTNSSWENVKLYFGGSVGRWSVVLIKSIEMSHILEKTTKDNCNLRQKFKLR